VLFGRFGRLVQRFTFRSGNCKGYFIVVTGCTFVVDKFGENVNGLIDEMVRFRGQSICRVMNGVSCSEMVDDVGKGNVSVLMVVFVLMAQSVESFMEIVAILSMAL
jgi:hypothetical protein